MQKTIDQKNIIIIRTDRIGEVLLSTAVVNAIKKCYPKTRISFMTSPYSKDIVDNRKDIEEILVADTIKKGAFLRDTYKISAELKKKKFDVSIVLNPHKGLHLACFLAGIPLRMGYDRKWGILLNRKIKDLRNEGEKHEVEYALDLLNLVGIKDVNPEVYMTVDKNSQISISEKLKNKGVDEDSKIITIHPSSSNAAKIWPYLKYVDLIKKIKSNIECEVIILGAKQEKELSEKIIKEVDENIIDMTGELNLKELAALIKKADLFIGNDAGPMHISAAVTTPVIAIFGRNIPGVSPRRWGPWGVKNVVFHKDPGCDPCYDRECPYEYKCLNSITVDEVFEAVKGMMESE